MSLSKEEKSLLIDIVLQAIKARLDGKVMLAPPGLSPALLEEKGAFVTLKKRGRLRGCIGYIEARKPLWQAVAELAVASAFSDHRFPPLVEDELRNLSVEISVLTPLREIVDASEISVGTHGLYLRRGLNSGLLLPQVAVEHKWDRETFLAETCRKAGLPPDSWRSNQTQKYCFSAEIFASEEIKPL